MKLRSDDAQAVIGIDGPIRRVLAAHGRRLTHAKQIFAESRRTFGGVTCSAGHFLPHSTWTFSVAIGTTSGSSTPQYFPSNQMFESIGL
jgi:hypothetical protein